LEKIKRSFDRREEIGAEAGVFALVPCCGFETLFGGAFKYPYRRH
jgi:hypothetical protein